MSEDVCPECKSTDVSVVIDDERLGEKGAYTIVCGACPCELHVPAEATARSRIGALRTIVREHRAARVDGYIVDAFTAQMLVKVYEALSPANREKFGKPNLEKLVNLGWKVVS